MCFVSPFSSFNDEKIKVQVLTSASQVVTMVMLNEKIRAQVLTSASQVVTMITFDLMTKKKVKD